MTLFWMSTLVLTVLGIVVIVLPLWKVRDQDSDATRRDELNKAFYKDRLSELEEETSEGLVNDQAELITELKQSLLDDIPEKSQASVSNGLNAKMMIAPAVIIFLAITYSFYFKFGNIDKIQAWHEVSGNLPALSKKLMVPQGAELTDDEMLDLTLALRTKLHNNPDDAMGWLLLGRIGMANRDIETSAGAMKKAYKLEPHNPDIQLGYAQALMLTGEDAEAEQARQMLRRIIAKDRTNIRALSLLAFDAFERNEYQVAAEAWSLMRDLIGPEDPRAEMLERSIERALSRINAPDASELSVPVTVNLGSNVQLPEQGVVIVSVHPANGAPMPVAAVRLPLESFPLTISLDDTNSMIPERALSSLETLMVRARIDTDGNVSTKTGDWYGESSVVSIGEPVTLVIDNQY
ncbi:c-type cytochrome biogenesis protein CcmI [Vibrio sp. Of7-15]|uniref:c-type cytochrome biogenesis protein CcmI n=1 Tax=Vibrio sp. Of7-15 TaxID=2724879 RepID=UPI001EF1FBC0|nr:c-type cytochrome biogenesis protein CcmI [Vibrio sp. Of7-15]MCG7499118.1 c-type cytochrome biogenesis protein CcmI [Vibrio sp. Of7-15]